MTARIIVAFDGSDLAQEAMQTSIAMAQALGASIVGLHVLEPVPPPIIAESMAGIDAAPALADFDDAARKDMDAARERFESEFSEIEAKCKAAGVAFSSIIQVGLLIPALVDLAGGNDMIAIGMKGRFARAGLGSSAKSLIKKAPCPVLIATGPHRDVSRILGVFDGSSVSKRACALAQRMATATGWPLTVLAAECGECRAEESKAKAEELMPECRVISADPSQKSEAEQIECAAKQADDAIIVMGAYPDSWLHQLFFGFGGTTAKVLSHVGAPVVMVH